MYECLRWGSRELEKKPLLEFDSTLRIDPNQKSPDSVAEWDKASPSTLDRGPSLNLPVIGSLVYGENSALDHAATKAVGTTRSIIVWTSSRSSAILITSSYFEASSIMSKKARRFLMPVVKIIVPPPLHVSDLKIFRHQPPTSKSLAHGYISYGLCLTSDGTQRIGVPVAARMRVSAVLNGYQWLRRPLLPPTARCYASLNCAMKVWRLPFGRNPNGKPQWEENSTFNASIRESNCFFQSRVPKLTAHMSAIRLYCFQACSHIRTQSNWGMCPPTPTPHPLKVLAGYGLCGQLATDAVAIDTKAATNQQQRRRLKDVNGGTPLPSGSENNRALPPTVKEEARAGDNRRTPETWPESNKRRPILSRAPLGEQN
uniref:Uncharacterized protein n=1 Tax=Timema douglasi TaxID=61478 RepID=A0A7R8VAP4_TIMDO|nr:unnamed protein product [Timema douglasi]